MLILSASLIPSCYVTKHINRFRGWGCGRLWRGALFCLHNPWSSSHFLSLSAATLIYLIHALNCACFFKSAIGVDVFNWHVWNCSVFYLWYCPHIFHSTLFSFWDRSSPFLPLGLCSSYFLYLEYSSPGAAYGWLLPITQALVRFSFSEKYLFIH